MLTWAWATELDEAGFDRIWALLSAAQQNDGRPELSGSRTLPGEFVGGTHLLVSRDDHLVGYGHLDLAGDSAGRLVGELIVHPAHRREGIAAATVTRMVSQAATFKPAGTLRMWSHGDHPGAAQLAAKAEFSRVRELLILHLDFGSAELAEIPSPQGSRLRAFEPGRDEQTVVEVNKLAFAWHPEQGQLSVDDIHTAEQEDNFDPGGFFLAEDEQGQLQGFHWTKVHPAQPNRFGGKPVGEVYVLGVHPSAQGAGLGKVLTLTGLHYLRDAGLDQVILYVESDNAPAVAVYQKLGFTHYEKDVQYEQNLAL